jgi:Zn-dependent M28 family amino/carboxypeptidase
MLGATYYVSAPIFPLDRTAAYINVDCVGVGEIVFIYGQNAMVDQLQASAVTFGFATILEPENLADDLPFHNAGIPAAGLMLNPDSSSFYPQLHRPEDDPPIIQRNSLRIIGTLCAHALFAWSIGG